MKKIFTLLAVMGISVASFAQWQNGAGNGRGFDNRNNSYNNYNSSALTINAFTERRYTVIVDNMQYQLNNGYGRGYDNTINVGAMAQENILSLCMKAEVISGEDKDRKMCIVVHCFLNPVLKPV